MWLSLDLSHLAIDTDPAGVADRLARIAAALPPGRRIQVGVEDAARTDGVLGCVLDVAGRGLADRLGASVQANLQRSERDVDSLIAVGVLPAIGAERWLTLRTVLVMAGNVVKKQRHLGILTADRSMYGAVAQDALVTRQSAQVQVPCAPHARVNRRP